MTFREAIGFGVGVGAGFVVPDSAMIPFADNAARDAWATANLSDLVQNQTVVEVTGTPDNTWYLWRGPTNPAMYDNTLWIDATPLIQGPTGPQGMQGDAGADGMGVDFTGFADGDLLRYNMMTGTTEPAALRQLTGLVSSSQTLRPPGDRALDIGPISAVSEGSTVSFLDRSRDQMFGAVIHETTPGVGVDRRTFYFRPADTFTQTPSGADTSETFTGTTLQFQVTNGALGTALEYRNIQRAAGSAEITGANLTIRRNSHTDPNPVFDYIRDINGAMGFTLNGGAGTTMTTIDLAREHLFLAGETLYITVTGDGTTPLNILGQTIGGQMIPSFTVHGRLGTIVFLEDYLGLPASDGQVLASTTAGVRSWVTQSGGISGIVVEDEGNPLSMVGTTFNFVGAGVTATGTGATKTITIPGVTAGNAVPSLHNFSINIPSRVDIGTNLNVQHTVSFDVTNYSLLTELTLIVTDGDDPMLTLPIRDGVQSQTVTLSGTVTSAATTVTFQLSGTYAGGTVTSNIQTVTVANVQAQERAYVGARTTNDFATVDVAQLMSFDVTQSGSVYSFSQLVNNTEVLGILSPFNRDPVSVRSILGDDLPGFTATADVRTISGISYNLLTLTNNGGQSATFEYTVTTE